MVPVSVLYLLLMISALVVVHELGHFVAARVVGLPVELVSLGYGQPWFARQVGETVYQIGRFPLGGYVRIAGASDDASPGGVLPFGKSLVVTLAGPAANLVLAGFVYVALFAQHTELRAAVIGDVVPDGAAMKAGLQPGDRVTAVNELPVLYWEDLENAVRNFAGSEVTIRFVRDGRTFERLVVVPRTTVRRREGRSELRGWLGVTHAPFAPLIGVLDPTSPAALAGLRTGDLIISVDGVPTPNWSAVKQLLARGRRMRVVYLRSAALAGAPYVRTMQPGFADVVPRTAVVDGERHIESGIEHAEMFVAHVDVGSPAAAAGLLPGDFVVALDEMPISTWRQLDQVLQSKPDHVWTLTYQRSEGGQVVTKTCRVAQASKAVPDAYGHAVTMLAFGAHHRSEITGGAMVAIDGRATYALRNGVGRLIEAVRETARGFWAVLTARGELGGALAIFRAANVSTAQSGAAPWLMLALISVNLGLLNLLPIPTLDGGQILLTALESVRRRPVSLTMRERIQWAGILFIVLVTVLALGNDMRRYFG